MSQPRIPNPGFRNGMSPIGLALSVNPMASKPTEKLMIDLMTSCNNNNNNSTLITAGPS